MNLDALDDDDDAGGEQGAPAWMATFSDLATLLLTFFVLLLSFAELDVTEFRSMLGSIREAFGVQIEETGRVVALNTTPIEFSDHESSPRLPLTDRQTGALRAIKRFIRQRDLQDAVEVEKTEEGVVVRLRDSVTFRVGSDVLRREGEPILDRIAELVSAFPDGLSIDGHTDDTPVHTGRFPSNWELSTARAAAVLRYLQRDGPLAVHHLRVAGYAATRPLAPNDTPEGRARNRRVELLFQTPAPAAGRRRRRRLPAFMKDAALPGPF